MVANQTASGFNRGLSSNYGWLRSANHVKFTEQYVMYMEKHVLVKKKVYKWAKHALRA